MAGPVSKPVELPEAVETAIERAATYAQFECLRREIAKALLLREAQAYEAAQRMVFREMCEAVVGARKQAAALGEEG
jgi:hypothetical protein